MTFTHANIGFLHHWTWGLVTYPLPNSNFRQVAFYLLKNENSKQLSFIFISIHGSEPITICPMVETNYGGTTTNTGFGSGTSPIPNQTSFGSGSSPIPNQTSLISSNPSTILVNNLTTHVHDQKKY
jgi:hypothetical protein